MDEILIEDKKYVSSKRAAKMTGYAQDYIGQLCREGRVPARLVGRSWYVLESAIQDHRFGTDDVTEEKVSTSKMGRTAPVTWDAPHYEAVESKALPAIQHIEDESILSPIQAADKYEIREAQDHLQESWRTWFENTANTLENPDMTPVSLVISETHEEVPEESVAKVEMVETPVVSVPLRAMDQLAIRRSLIRGEQTSREYESLRSRKPVSSPKNFLPSIQVAGLVVASVAVILAIAGSGYWDVYLTSDSRASAVAGVVFYNR